MTPGLDYYNASRSWRRALRDYERALTRMDYARDRAIRAQYHLHRSVERACELKVFGDGLTQRLMQALSTDAKTRVFGSVWEALVDMRRLLEVFGMKRTP